MYVIARGLESGNPIAYLLIFMILYPPVIVIIFTIIDKINDWKKFRKEKK